jgi:hypothetical protein
LYTYLPNGKELAGKLLLFVQPIKSRLRATFFLLLFDRHCEKTGQNESDGASESTKFVADVQLLTNLSIFYYPYSDAFFFFA